MTKVSTIIVTHNRLVYTKQCVSILKEYLPLNSEIIIVDNGSSDGTQSWLSGQAVFRVIYNKDNRSLAAAFNQESEYLKVNIYFFCIMILC